MANFDQALAAKIDHTLLKADARSVQYRTLVEEALEYGFAAVCVPPTFIGLVQEMLSGSKVKTATVIGFPLGYATVQSKVKESLEMMSLKVDELDMVLNISKLRDGDFSFLQGELKEMRKATEGAILKVIIETALLNNDEKITAAKLCTEAGVDFVKTSTGFAGGGATVKDVMLLRAELPKEIKIKASGGIKTYKFAQELVAAGANRLGCSSSIQVVQR